MVDRNGTKDVYMRKGKDINALLSFLNGERKLLDLRLIYVFLFCIFG